MKMLPEPVRLKGGKYEQRRHVTFGGDLPKRPGDFGLEVVHGMAWLVRAHEADETERRRKDAEQEIHLQRLMPADALRIRGRHNAINALSALALATSAGCQLAPMLYGLREYRGEPHRVDRWASSTRSSTSTTARAPTSAPRSPPCRAWAPSAGW
jgi:UDP-N-acetylmuramoylalanine--D-glutamate ligase